MSDPGWTWGDLAGELWARGIDPDSVSSSDLWTLIDAPRPEIAADCYANGETYAERRRRTEERKDSVLSEEVKHVGSKHSWRLL